MNRKITCLLLVVFICFTAGSVNANQKTVVNTRENIAGREIEVEINNSADFNQYYPKDAKLGDANYSGGKWGSGQPALVYAAVIDIKETKEIQQDMLEFFIGKDNQ